MQKSLLTILSVLVLSGCQTVSKWHKDGVTADQEYIDLKSCEFEAKKHDESALRSGDSSQQRFREIRDLCLESKGYKKISEELSIPDVPFLSKFKESK